MAATLPIGSDHVAVPSTKRVSYILPAVHQAPQSLRLPSLEANLSHLQGRSGPLVIPAELDTAKTPIAGHSRGLPGTSYNDHPRHALPVSSLALDTSTILESHSDNKPTGILYTGGRDGMIGAWELGLRLKRRRQVNRYSELEEDEDGEMEATTGLLDEMSMDRGRISSTVTNEDQWEVDKRGGEEAPSAPAAKFRQCLGSHTDWINDIVLCNRNQTVVSASSDRSIKIWNPHDPTSSMMPQTLGTHNDYVRCLALAPKANWIASGSFDKTIKVWDLNEMRSDPILTIAEPNLRTSVYALAVNAWGGVMAAASPEKTIQLWDPRSGQQISQLVGHQDNVRSVVLSQDGTHLLSASSDSTIRLWSLGEQRCLHTFTHHSDSVWSLYSDHDSLDVFYSGDRSGIVCKVDWERCNEVSEGECVVLAKEKCKEGEAKFNRGCPQDSKAAGIYKIVALDDSYFWTANSNSVVNRWKDVPRRSKRESLYPITSHTYPPADSSKQTRAASSFVSSPLVPNTTRPSALKGHTNSTSTIPTSVSFAERTSISLRRSDSHDTAMVASEMCDDKGRQAATLYGLPFASLVCLAPPNDPYGAAIGLGSISMRTLDRRDSVASQSPAHAMFSSASLISIPSVLRATATSHHDSFNPHSPPGDSLTSTSPAAFNPHLASAHNRFLDAARPSSTRSSSIRFAPLKSYNLYNNEENRPGSYQEDDLETAQANEDDDALEARQAFEERDSSSDATPLRSSPDDVIVGSHGLIRSSMLNDRRHVLAIDSAGQIFLWDIVSGRCLGVFDWVEVAQAWSLNTDPNKEKYLLPGDALDIVKERIQGEGATPMWCTVDTRIGSLSVHFDYPRCFDAEIYLDEMEDVLKESDSKVEYKDDQRINIARLVLRNLFDGFIHQEAQLRSGNTSTGLQKGQLALERPNKKPDLKLELGKRRPLDHIPESVQTPGMTVALAVAAKTPAILPIASPLTPRVGQEMFGLQQLLTLEGSTTAGVDNSTEKATNHSSDDYFSLYKNGGSSETKPQTPQQQPKVTSPSPGILNSPVSPGGSGLMGRLRMSIKRGDQNKKEDRNVLTSRLSATSTAGEDEQTSKTASSEKELMLANVRRIMTLADPTKVLEDMPRIPFPSKTAIMISEASPDSANLHVDYRGLVKCTEKDVATLELSSPPWLLEYLVGASEHTTPLKDKDKLTFLLTPWEPPSTTKEGVPSFEIMPTMPMGNSRLTATKMLRVRKACIYVADKLNIVEEGSGKSGAHSIVSSRRNSNIEAQATSTSSPSNINSSNNPFLSTKMATQSKVEPYENIELLCNGILLPSHCTLAQIQRFYWKNSGILKLEYRWRITT